MKIGKKLAGTLAIPALVLAVCLLISGLRGTVLFDSQLSWITFIRAAANVVLVTFALSINLNSGRFDFSIGSVALLSSVISSSLALNLDLPAPVMLLISISRTPYPPSPPRTNATIAARMLNSDDGS